MSNFTFIDLFAGIGGFHTALTPLGGECVMACEIDKDAQMVYKSTFPNTPLVSNIRSLTRDDINDRYSSKPKSEINKLVPDHDLLCGGFPCQAFSKSGKQLGFDDQTRGTLFFDILEIVKVKKPKYIILENVKNLVSKTHVNTWDVIITSLQQQGYSVSTDPTILSPHLLLPEMGGAPQVRERVFIVAVRDKRKKPFYAPKDPFQSSHNPDNWDISDYLTPDKDIDNLESYQLSTNEKNWVEAWDYFVSNVSADKLPGFPIWVDSFKKDLSTPDMPKWKIGFMQKNHKFYNENKKFIDKWLCLKWGNGDSVLEFPPSRRKFEWQANKAFPNKQGRTLRALTFQFRPSGIRVKAPTYLPALVAITQTSILGPEVSSGLTDYRKMTVMETAKLQCQDGEIFSKAGATDRMAYKQLGNSVNSGVITYIAKAILDL